MKKQGIRRHWRPAIGVVAAGSLIAGIGGGLVAWSASVDAASRNAGARDKGQVKSATSRLVTSPSNQVAGQIRNQGGVASGATINFRWLSAQVGSYPDGTSGVDTADLTIPGTQAGGQPLWLATYIGGWGPAELANWQAQLDASSLPLGLAPYRPSCGACDKQCLGGFNNQGKCDTDADCEDGNNDGTCETRDNCNDFCEAITGSGLGAGCNVAPINDDTCSPAFLDYGRADAEVFGFAACSIATSNLTCAAIIGIDEPAHPDPGVEKYGATFVLLAGQSLAGGPHTIEVVPPDGATFMNDGKIAVKVGSATLTIAFDNGCFGVAPGTPCDDGNACTDGDYCDGNGGCSGVPDPGCEDEESPPECTSVDSSCCSDGTESVGDPFYPHNGEVHESFVDLRIAGRGADFVWARKYRSRIGPNTEMGNGWDFSYNLRIEQSGSNLLLCDGNTRRDIYRLQPDGSWARNDSFRRTTQNVDDTYTLTIADTGSWTLNAWDGSADQGKIASLTDRNSNTLTFDYDGLGRLVTIHDTLDTASHNRDITIAYNSDGFIESVTDWTGRTITYAYYDGVEPGGNAGDLKSVTSPAVTGTPNGNDFPDGKTTLFTYSTGFTDDRLNHNLLTITDPKGQTYVQNEYYPTTDPDDFNFDRIKRQTWGDPGDIIDIVYVEQTPSAANNFAVIKTIINDRVGNVDEYSYNAANQMVIHREYTGRWDADQPTTNADLMNPPPIPRLRPTDPDFFEERREYNNDSLVTRIIHPNGNEEQFVYDVLNVNPRSRGNLLEHCRMPGPLGGDQAQICESFEYDDGFGGCCGTNFVTKHVDGRGNETLHDYDVRGNRLHTQHRIPSIVEDFEYNQFGQMTSKTLPDNGSAHRRRDEYTFYDSGIQLGYLHEGIIDAPAFALTTT